MSKNRRLLLGEIRSKNIGDLAIVEVAELNLDISLKRSLSPDSVKNKYLFHLVNIFHTLKMGVIIKTYRITIVTVYGGQIIRNNFHWALRIWLLSFLSKIELHHVGVDNTFNPKALFFWRKGLKRVNSIIVRDNNSFENLKKIFGIVADVKIDPAYQMKPLDLNDRGFGSIGVFMSYKDFQRHNISLSEASYIEFHNGLIEKYQIDTILSSTQSDFDYWKTKYTAKCIPYTSNVSGFVRALCAGDLIISARMHPLIFGEINARSLVVLAFTDKLDGYAKELGQRGYEDYSICNL